MPNLLGPFIFGAIATCALKLLRGKKVTLGSALTGGLIVACIFSIPAGIFGFLVVAAFLITIALIMME